MELFTELLCAFKYFEYNKLGQLNIGDKVKFTDEYLDFFQEVKKESLEKNYPFCLVNDPEVYRGIEYEIELIREFYGHGGSLSIALKDLEFFSNCKISFFILHPTTHRSINGIPIFMR